jgi:2-methylcitrate dehydratase PrpD
VPQIDAAFNLQYNVSNALLRKSTKLEHYTEACVRDADIAALVSRVRLTADMPAEKPLSARVKIRMKNGSEYMKQVDMPKGNGIYTPLTGAEKREKFFDNVRFAESLPVDRAEKALDMIEKLERVTDTGEIVRLLVA